MTKLFYIGLLAAALSGLAAAQESGYRISGTVLDAATNQSLPKAIVQIASTRQRGAAQFGVTDANGTFTFANLIPGKYSLLAGRSNSGMQLYQGEDNYSTAIVVGPGLDSEHIVFPLTPLGSINGTILDEEGLGVRNAQVHLYWQHTSSGQPEISRRGVQMTKSSGQFHFGHLRAGTYYLAVLAHPWYAQHIYSASNAAREFDVAYPVTYYADATDPSSAQPVTLTEGGTATVQMTLRAVPAIHVGIPTSEATPGRSMQPNIFALGLDGERIPVSSGYMVNANNRSELGGIAPGRYEIQMQTFESGNVHVMGTKAMDLQNGSELDLSTASHASIAGHITFEGGVRPPERLQLHFIRVGGGTFAQAPVASDGSFRVQDGTVLVPGRYRIELPNPGQFHLQSIAVKAAQWKEGFLELAEGSNAQVSLVVSTVAAELGGIALRDDKPVAGATVLLFPEDPNRADLIRRDQSDSDGTFTLPGVLPGRYRVLAVDNGHNLAYQNPAVIKPYLPSAQPVTVTAGKQTELKINVQTRLP